MGREFRGWYDTQGRVTTRAAGAERFPRKIPRHVSDGHPRLGLLMAPPAEVNGRTTTLGPAVGGARGARTGRGGAGGEGEGAVTGLRAPYLVEAGEVSPPRSANVFARPPGAASGPRTHARCDRRATERGGHRTCRLWRGRLGRNRKAPPLSKLTWQASDAARHAEHEYRRCPHGGRLY